VLRRYRRAFNGGQNDMLDVQNGGFKKVMWIVGIPFAKKVASHTPSINSPSYVFKFFMSFQTSVGM